MLRLRALALLASIALVLGAGSVALAGADEPPSRDEPAVTIGDPTELAEDEAWTFRFLVPALIAMSAIGLVATGLAYTRRVKARYRVAR